MALSYFPPSPLLLEHPQPVVLIGETYGVDAVLDAGFDEVGVLEELRDAQRKLLDGLLDDGTDASLVDCDVYLNR